MRYLNRFPFALIILVLILSSGCDGISSLDLKPSKTEALLMGEPWELSSYYVHNGPAGDGFGVAELFHFKSDYSFRSMVNGYEYNHKWIYDDHKRTVYVYGEFSWNEKFPWKENRFEFKIEEINEERLVLRFWNFGYDITARFVRQP